MRQDDVSDAPGAQGKRHALKKLNILLATGDEDGGRRATLAFSAACSALVIGYEVIVYMVGDGMCWGNAGHAEYFHAAGYPPLNQLMEKYLEGGGLLYRCASPVEPCTTQNLHEAVQLMGFTSFIDRIEGGNTLTF